MGNRNLDDADSVESTEKPNEAQLPAEQLESAKVVDKINAEVGGTAGIEEQRSLNMATFDGRVKNYNNDLMKETNGEFTSAADMIKKTGELLCTDCMKQSIQDFLKSVGGTAGGFDFSGQIRQAVDQLTAAARQEAAARDGVPPGTTPGDTRLAATGPAPAAYPIEAAQTAPITPGSGRPPSFMGDASPTPSRPPVDSDEADIGAPGDVGELPPEVAAVVPQRDVPVARQNQGDGGDRSNRREIDPAKDNPEAVRQRYAADLQKQVDAGRLSASDAAHMGSKFNEYMRTMEGKHSPEDMSRICSSMNRIMESNKMGDLAKLNTCVDLACKGASPRDSNGQGAHNSCAPTSLSRVLQQKDFAAYTEQIASVASTGSAWVGEGNLRKQITVNDLNFSPDRESAAPWNEARARNGQRGMAGQLDNALNGQLMANIAGQRDGCQYEYVAANARSLGATSEQSQTGEGLFRVNGNQREFVAACPPASIDVVAAANHVTGGGGLYVHESLAAQFRNRDGSYPPGMIAFKDAADLRTQLAQRPGNTEFQIVTNGTMVAGMQGHGLHAQTISLQDGKLVAGNNWTAQHNHRVYSDEFFNAVTDKRQWGNYQFQTGPDGQPIHDGNGKPIDRDFKKEYMDDDRNKTAAEKQELEARQQKEQKDKEQKDKEQKDKEQLEKQKLEQQKKYADWQASYQKWTGDLTAAQGSGNMKRVQELLGTEPRLTN